MYSEAAHPTLKQLEAVHHCALCLITTGKDCFHHCILWKKFSIYLMSKYWTWEYSFPVFTPHELHEPKSYFKTWSSHRTGRFKTFNLRHIYLWLCLIVSSASLRDLWRETYLSVWHSNTEAVVIQQLHNNFLSAQNHFI